MKNKIALIIATIFYTSLGIANTKSVSEKKTLINSIFTNNTFLISEKLSLLFQKNNITTSFDQLSFNIYLNQAPIFSVINQINNPFWFQFAAKANRLEIQAYQQFQNSQYHSAQAKYKLALAQSIDSNNMAQQMVILKNLSLITYAQGKNQEATVYNNLLISHLNKQPGNYNLLIKCIIQKSKLALAQGNIKQAEDLIYKSALPMSNGLANKNLLFDSFLALSQIYLKSKSYTQSKWFAIQALDLAQKRGFRNKQIIGLIALAKVKSQTGDYGLAQQNLQSATQLCNKNSLYLADIYQTSYLNSKRMGNQNLAQAYQNKFVIYQNALTAK
jgi:hypothetical protein